MMIARLAAVLALWPVCAMAEPEMTRDACIRGWQAFATASGQVQRLREIEPVVTGEGWCRIDRSIAELSEKDFGRLVWRATGVEQAVEQRGFPKTLEAEFGGIDLDAAFGLQFPPKYAGAMGGLDVKALRDPETRAFQVDTVAFDFGGLGSVTLSGQGGGVDLSGLDRMQLTWGALRFHDLRLRLETTPALTGALKKALLTEEIRGRLPELVAELPSTSISQDSRAALRSFVEHGSEQAGTLEIVATSDAGLGAGQIMGAVMKRWETPSGDAGMAAMLEHILSGVVLEVQWHGKT